MNRYRANCYTCWHLYIPKDKKPGFLHLLPILDRLQQHIIVDFKKCLKSKASYNIIAIFVDRLGKRPIIVLVRDTIIARELALLFLLHVVQHVSILEIVVSDRGPQFISDFQNEFYKRISIKLKLSTTNYPQTNN